MRIKWVLIGFGILYLLFALSFMPTEKILPKSVEEAWWLPRDILWAGMTIASIGLLEAMGPLARPLASASGLRLGDVAEIMLAVILLAVAVYSAVRLRRKDLTPRWRGTHAFFLLLALTLVVMVRFTLYSWSNFG
jgi:ABC-type xylose transport system permease subunit